MRLVVGNKIADSYGAGSIEMFRLEEALNKAIPRLGEVDLRDYTEEEKTLTIDLGVQP